jgi:hypothetical protein
VRPATNLDILVVTDLRFSGGTSTSLVEELRAAAAAGYRTGLLHLASPRLGPSAVVHPVLRRLVENGSVHLVTPGEPVCAPLTIVKHPTVFAQSLGGALPVDTDAVVVTVGQVPADAAGVYYDEQRVDAHIVEALGVKPLWAPVSSAVRVALRGVAIAAEDWTEIIDVDAWRRPIPRSRDGLATAADDRLVIGRHSRPDPLKWPSDASELRAVYPIDGTVRVRVLGGADAAGKVLGSLPDEWEILPFGSVAPQEFLAGLDAFVYYHHPDLTEAFGRTILEALAAGVVVVVPHHFRPSFGDACLYADPRQALVELRKLLDDPAAHRAHLDRADHIVRTRFGHDVHQQRLERLIGLPTRRAPGAGTPVVPSLALAPPGLRAAYTTTLVACLGSSATQVDATLRALDRHRRQAPGFIPLVVVTIGRPTLAAELGIETAIITSPTHFDASVESWATYAQRRLRQLAAHHGADNVVPADPTHEYAWIAMQLGRSRR